MLKLIQVTDLLQMPSCPLLLDARSEGEFNFAHIPGAVSFPILNNDERKEVGTCYKQRGHEAAVLLGYKLVGAKFEDYLKHAYQNFKGQDVYLHCWRGGLRSRIMANLLDSAGFRVFLIQGGYKAYRQEVLRFLQGPFQFKVLGGYTGSGKTRVLQAMAAKGAQVLDLEALASHRGSAFGALGLAPQPKQEHFENLIFETLRRFDPNKTIWVEDESRLTGTLQIPNQVYAAIREARVWFLQYSLDYRAQITLEEYGGFDTQVLAEITAKLRKRMGDLMNRVAIETILQGDKETWVRMVLQHYDKQYDYGVGQRPPANIHPLTLSGDELLNTLMAL